MISAWWMIPVFMAGALIGALFMGLCCAGSDHRDL